MSKKQGIKGQYYVSFGISGRVYGVVVSEKIQKYLRDYSMKLLKEKSSWLQWRFH